MDDILDAHLLDDEQYGRADADLIGRRLNPPAMDWLWSGVYHEPMNAYSAAPIDERVRGAVIALFHEWRGVERLIEGMFRNRTREDINAGLPMAMQDIVTTRNVMVTGPQQILSDTLVGRVRVADLFSVNQVNQNNREFWMRLMTIVMSHGWYRYLYYIERAFNLFASRTQNEPPQAHPSVHVVRYYQLFSQLSNILDRLQALCLTFRRRLLAPDVPPSRNR